MSAEWLVGLSDTEQARFAKLLAAPGLWAFACVMDKVGLQRATELCENRKRLPDDIRVLLAAHMYSPDLLPDAAGVRYAVLGCRIESYPKIYEARRALQIDRKQSARAKAMLVYYRSQVEK